MRQTNPQFLWNLVHQLADRVNKLEERLQTLEKPVEKEVKRGPGRPRKTENA